MRQNRLGRDESERLGNGLGDQQAVKRVAMVQREPAYANSMRGTHRKLAETAAFDGRRQLVWVRVDLAQAGFDGDLPNRGSGDENLVRRFQDSTRRRLQ